MATKVVIERKSIYNAAAYLFIASHALIFAFIALHGYRPLVDVIPDILTVMGLVVLVGLIVGHELLHALGFLFAGVRLRSLSFNVFPPSVHSSDEISKVGMLVAVLLPLVVLGVVPQVFGLASSEPLSFIVGTVMITPCVGDVVIAARVAKVPGDAKVRGHPTEIGFEISF